MVIQPGDQTHHWPSCSLPLLLAFPCCFVSSSVSLIQTYALSLAVPTNSLLPRALYSHAVTLTQRVWAISTPKPGLKAQQWITFSLEDKTCKLKRGRWREGGGSLPGTRQTPAAMPSSPLLLQPYLSWGGGRARARICRSYRTRHRSDVPCTSLFHRNTRADC